MMNKRASRLIALLLSAIMVINIAPVTAIAEGQEEIKSPGLVYDETTGYPEAGTLSGGAAPSGTMDEFTVQYVIKSDYTYSKKNLVLVKSPSQCLIET